MEGPDSKRQKIEHPQVVEEPEEEPPKDGDEPPKDKKQPPKDGVQLPVEEGIGAGDVDPEELEEEGEWQEYVPPPQSVDGDGDVMMVAGGAGGGNGGDGHNGDNGYDGGNEGEDDEEEEEEEEEEEVEEEELEDPDEFETDSSDDEYEAVLCNGYDT